jgi:hypothetical protein
MQLDLYLWQSSASQLGSLTGTFPHSSGALTGAYDVIDTWGTYSIIDTPIFTIR